MSASPGRRLAPLVLALAGCRGPSPLPEALVPLRPAAQEPAATMHKGPQVVGGGGGPARFAAGALEGFDQARAAEVLAFVDGFYRAPANAGYEAVLDRLESELRRGGFGSHPRLQLHVLTQPLDAEHFADGARRGVPAWTPLSGSARLRSTAGEEVLHAFEAPGDVDRVMLPVRAPGGSAEGRIALGLEELDPGEVLVISSPPRPDVLARAHGRGAVAVVSSALESYNVDPTGAGAEQDAIQFRSLRAETPLMVVMISPRSHERIRSALARDAGTVLCLEASVRLDERPLRTLVAVVRGRDRAHEAVAIASHVQEPGANDNASGVVGLLEGALWLGEEVRSGRVSPSRSLVFLWGDEFRQTRAWFASTDLTPVAGLSSDMTGESRERTGAIPLLERMPDPAALLPLPPDEHTPWGQKQVRADSLLPNGLALIARCALVDVGRAAGGWETAEHPYEGGSDHDVFLAAGVPSALFWHFTDFAYHTSLDRLDMVDVGEMARMGAALLATALAVADPLPGDLERYLRSLDLEEALRVEAAQEAGEAELAEQWRTWCFGARQWLRNECLRIPPAKRIPPR